MPRVQEGLILVDRRKGKKLRLVGFSISMGGYHQANKGMYSRYLSSVLPSTRRSSSFRIFRSASKGRPAFSSLFKFGVGNSASPSLPPQSKSTIQNSLPRQRI